MGLPFFNGKPRRPDELISVDLGGRTTKVVEVQRSSGGYAISRYAVVDAPNHEKELSSSALADHLKCVFAALGSNTKSVSVALDVNDSLLRHADLPLMPLDDMRQVLKTSTKTYLQQDLPDYAFDCFLTLSKSAQKEDKTGASPANAKPRVLVAGARNQLIRDMEAGVKAAGLTVESIVPGLIGPVNAFEMALPEVFANEAVALIELGFRNTSICLLQDGELVLSRVVGIGGDKLTSGLAETLGISYAEAESIKVGLPGEVQSNLESLLSPLCRELRASIDCFEHQQDRPISQAYISGAASRSEAIMKILQDGLMVECKSWNPLTFLKQHLPAAQAAEVEQAAPQLTVAIGAAISVF